MPLVSALLRGALLTLAISVGPGLNAHSRIRLGLLAVTIGVAVTPIKIPVDDEPEGVVSFALDTVMLALLLLARRGAKSG